MTGPMQAPDGSEIPPTGKSFEIDFYTIAKWHDLVTFLKQIGLSE